MASRWSSPATATSVTERGSSRWALVALLAVVSVLGVWLAARSDDEPANLGSVDRAPDVRGPALSGSLAPETAGSAPDDEPRAGWRMQGPEPMPEAASLLRFHVRDAQSRAALRAARVLRMWGPEAHVEEMPSPSAETCECSEVHTADEDGVVTLLAPKHVADWWIGAPGYRWTRARTPPDAHDQQVALDRGGAVEVEVVLSSLVDPYRVFAVHPDHRRGDRCFFGATLLETPGTRGSYGVAGLAPGPWRVVLGSPGPFCVQEVWASIDVEVRAGETTRARLVVPPRERLERHELVGSIVVPPAWRTRPDRVLLRARTPGVDVDGERRFLEDAPGDPWSFRFAELPPAVYEIWMPEIDFRRLVHVPEERALDLRVPPPVRVRALLLDARTGKPVEDPDIFVHFRCDGLPWTDDEGGPIDEHADDWSLHFCGHAFAGSDGAGADGVCEVLVPATGDLLVLGQAPGYLDTPVRWTRADGSPLRIQMAAAARLRVRILRGGRLFEAATGRIIVRAQAPRPGSYSSMGDVRGGGRAWDDLRAGTYRVSWSGSEDEREVVLDAGETTTVDFEVPE